MIFHSETANIYVPDGQDIDSALTRTTHMTIAAHPDDIEMMAAQPIIECYNRDDLWFSGVIMADGHGSPRTGKYKDFTDDEMCTVRQEEQFKAAEIGEYAAQAMLGYPSAIIKDRKRREPLEDLSQILRIAKPQLVYTHNLADKHDTHVAVALRVIDAVRSLPLDERPAKLFGCEVWRGLDWLLDEDKVKMDLSEHENLQTVLLSVYDSQIVGGKRYDLAIIGRRRANATFSESHETDSSTLLGIAMDMSLLIKDDNLDPSGFVQGLIERFAQDVTQRLQKFS